jgi:acetyl-CoA decarbonylase/synthase complex subunit gamma
VLVTASYGLSFDHVRRALAGRHAWILVLDTKGVNVWCAAGKGTFGTDELVRRIGVVRLGDVVAHRHLVVPQLGAPGVAAHEVQHATGFRVHYGPVRSADLPAYLDAGRRATDEMRRVRFSSTDRAVVIPMEIRPALKPLAMYAVLVLLASAPGAGGPSLARAWAEGLPLVGVGLVAILAGAVLTPLLLPVIPGRAFSVKGALVGALATAVYVAAVPAMARSVTSLAFAAIFGPAASSFLAFQFTGATTFTGISGVRKELRRSLPVHVGALLASAALLVARGIAEWR